ncbi:MAG: twitch domain-containing radical SAM protein [Bacteriovoracaceae bacterium]|nr:twitch domain-containing radical SAM protein [Bacteriovoracaceae bacterium]
MTTKSEIEKRLKSSKSFCLLPWLHLNINSNGSVNPCCETTDLFKIGNLENKTFEELANSPRLVEMRKKMLKGESCEECHYCKVLEDNGFPSKRVLETRELSEFGDIVEETNPDGTLNEFKLRYLDIRFSNQCNLSCRTCRPVASTGWYSDAKFLGMDHFGYKVQKPTKDNIILWEQIDKHLNHFEKIYFAGGEPVLQDDHYILLDKLIDQNKNDVSLFYTTNFSTLIYRNYDCVEYWNKFKSVTLGVSLDGMGAQGELIRKGLKWSDAESNLKRLKKECPHVKVIITSTVSSLNILHLLDFYEAWINEEKIEPENISIDLVRQPEIYSIQIFPKEVKEEISKIYSDRIENVFKNIPNSESLVAKLESIIQFMNEDDLSDKFSSFKKMTHVLDNLRGESYKELFPEMENFLK